MAVQVQVTTLGIFPGKAYLIKFLWRVGWSHFYSCASVHPVFKASASILIKNRKFWSEDDRFTYFLIYLFILHPGQSIFKETV